MSQQLQITGGAKVRSLEGVITGSTGVLGSLPINASNGIPQLDVNGKILVSQLPNSVMEYKGTWDAATNTPTLADGTGNQGDVYLCNVAGTVNFGSGPISFVVGDQVIYSGTIWQRASGATGSVTSVAVTETGDALTITGSPITTSGTINIGFAGTSAQYVAGDGSLITFPSIITEAQKLVTEVYNNSGATLTKGTVVYINGGQGNLPTVTKAIATGDSTSAQTYGVVQSDITNMNNGYVVVIGALNNLDTQAYTAGTQLYLSSTTAGAWTDVKQYAPAHLVYVGIVVRSHPTQGVVEVRIQNGFELDELHNVSAQTPSNNQGLFYNSSNSLWENKSIATALGYTPADDSLVVKLAGAQTITGVKTFSGQPKFDTAIAIKEGTSGALTGYTSIGANLNQLLIGIVGATHTLTFPTDSSYTYTFPSGTGTLALTSDIPSLTGYVTLATSQTITGDKTFTGVALFNDYQARFGGGVALSNTTSGGLVSGHTVLGANADGLQVNLAGGAYNNLKFANTATGRNYTFPDASGTLALSSDLSSYVPTSRTLTINGTTYDLSANRSWTIAEGLGGSGTTNYVAKFTGSTSVGDSLIFDNGTNVGIGTASPSSKLHVVGGTYSTLGFFVPDTSQISFTTANGNNGMNVNGTTGKVVLLSNGNETMTLDSAGKVGIGTTSPSLKLHVVGDTYSTTGMFIGNAGGYFSTLNTLNGLYLDSTNYLILNTNGNERFRISSAGNVGIGTSTFPSANYKLVVKQGTDRNLAIAQQGSVMSIEAYNDAANANVPLAFYASSYAFNNGAATFSRNDAANVSVTIANAYLNQGNLINFQQNKSGSTINAYIGHGGDNTGNFIINNGTQALTITNGGNVGIGTTSPSFKLDVQGGSIVNGNGTIQTALTYASMGIVGTLSNHDLAVYANNAERMRITSTGNVGIGTTSPTNLLTLVSAASNKGIDFVSYASLSTVVGSINFEQTNDILTIMQKTAYSGGALVLGTNSTERMRITSGGNVGIGTTAPYDFGLSTMRTLHVEGSDYGTVITKSGSIGSFLISDSTAGGQCGAVGTYTDHHFRFTTNNVERMRITTAGNLVVGSTTAAYAATNRNVIEVNGTTQSLIAIKSGDVKQGYFFVTGNGGDVYLTKDTGTNSFILQNQSNGVYLSVGATSWSSISDIRLKDISSNIESAVDSLMTLKTIKYNWKSDDTKKQNLGLIAQEVEKVFPEVISKSKFNGADGLSGSDNETEFLSVRYAELVPVLIKAIQELKKEIEELKNK